MPRLKKEFDTFYKDEVKFEGNAEIRNKKEKLKDDFLKSFPSKFKEKFDQEIKVKDIRFIDQGSYAIGTTINHGNKAYDIDIATIIKLDISQYTDPVEIKKVARDALTNTNREPSIKEPCISVKYTKEGEEKYHLDFPIYADVNGTLYLARGKEYAKDENKIWEEADPEGLNKYFREDNLQIEGQHLTDEEKKKRKKKKRIIRYIKWWKAEKYSNPSSDNEVPPSIALTILACQHFEYSECDLECLSKTVNNIFNEIFELTINEKGEEIIEIKECNLPKNPYTNCLSKLQESDNHIKKLYSRFKYLVDKLEIALSEKSDTKAGEYIVKVFGDKFPLPEEDKARAQDSFA